VPDNIAMNNATIESRKVFMPFLLYSDQLVHLPCTYGVNLLHQAGKPGIISNNECKVLPLLISKGCHDKFSAGELYLQ
jgi:hypothetical protein